MPFRFPVGPESSYYGVNKRPMGGLSGKCRMNATGRMFKTWTVAAALLSLAGAAAADDVPGANNARHLVGRYPTGVDVTRAMTIRGSVEIAAPPEAVAEFLGHMNRYFLELSPDNRKIEVVEAVGLVPGVEWLTEQDNDGEFVRARFKVVEADGSRRFTLVSDPSLVVIGNGEHATPTINAFTIEAKDGGGSTLSQRLVLCFNSLTERSGAQALGVKRAWQTHVDTALASAARLIESGAR